MQAASGQNEKFLSPQEGAIALGTFKLVGSLVAPLVVIKVPKKTVFIMSGAIASLSLATGNLK